MLFNYITLKLKPMPTADSFTSIVMLIQMLLINLQTKKIHRDGFCMARADNEFSSFDLEWTCMISIIKDGK